ncbi:hypothetical protein GII30_06415 [Gordonia amarae]|uniref:Uncharacterized protein n=1 Tax=Gordonia amarae TaxID=36821 RepID=A0A857KUN5_9ACTN|nr:hypothetical protein [Gordonia amarae]MCS3878003.1 hypothetical protein [Gordonia amarae]QHN16704.1 hypothetical protein GII35_06640 [Gordonia amarae]QHN21229.1 hypothetical protein GII34_06420 [Gordonia amarae]QHN30083.1 hypothetical protein GII32_06430 [Gordonia amarae]QHN38856.1 hypothetical protein GII30_06415 [Gordonia amarae]
MDKQRRADAEARARAVREANANAPDTSPAWAKGTAHDLNEVAHVPVATGQREKDNKAERIRKVKAHVQDVAAQKGMSEADVYKALLTGPHADMTPEFREAARAAAGGRFDASKAETPEVKVKPGHYRPAGPHFRNLKSVATMSDEDILDYAGQLHAATKSADRDIATRAKADLPVVRAEIGRRQQGLRRNPRIAQKDWTTMPSPPPESKPKSPGPRYSGKAPSEMTSGELRREIELLGKRVRGKELDDDSPILARYYALMSAANRRRTS